MIRCPGEEASALGEQWGRSPQHVGRQDTSGNLAQVKLLLKPAGGSPYLIRTTSLPANDQREGESTIPTPSSEGLVSWRTTAVRHSLPEKPRAYALTLVPSRLAGLG